MKDVLYISMCLPHSKSNHAGGQVANFFVNSLADQDDLKITLISKVLINEKKYLNDLNPKVDYHFIFNDKKGVKEALDIIYSLNSKFNPLYKYGNVLRSTFYQNLKKELYTLKNKNYQPDIIILEWTQMTLFVAEIKKIYPDAIYISIEEDVYFQSLYRKYLCEKKSLIKLYRYIQYKTMIKNERIALNRVQKVFVYSRKDNDLLCNAGVDTPIEIISVYFHEMKIKRNPMRNDILFYGNMGRPENYLSAIWFIENVMPLIEDLHMRFIILGANPCAELLKYKSENILVTGFVDNPDEYFSKSLCFVAPLVLGAGIKVKVLEAMTTGIPILTNHIGIEGIPAQNGKDFFLCENPEDYESILRKLVMGKIDAYSVALNEKKLLNNYFNINEAKARLISSIHDGDEV